MSPLFCSLKCLRYIGNVYKYIRINDSHINFRNLSHVPNHIPREISESTNSFQQSTENDNCERLYVNNIIRQINKSYEVTGVIPKRFIEQTIHHVVETAGKIEAWQALILLRYNNLLLQCIPQERVKLANTLWKFLNMYHIPIDVFHYNALLQVYIDNGHEFSPMEILTTMDEQGIIPNKDTYKFLLKYYCKKGNMFDSVVILKYMETKRYSIDRTIFNLLILGYSEAGDLKRAISLLRTMKKMDIAPKRDTYATIMCAFAKVNDIKSINEVLSHCKKRGIQFSDKGILDVIYTLIINNNMQHVNEMFSKIKELDFPANIHLLSKIMDTKQDVAMDIFFLILSKCQHRVYNNQVLYFFINKLMHTNACPESILNVCIHFETKYNNNKVIKRAIHFSFQHDNYAITLRLLKAWKDRGNKLRPHYFWPILAKLINKNDIKGLFHNLKEMVVTYDVTPCIDTLTDFVIPHAFYNVLNVQSELYKCGIPQYIIDNAIVYEFLKNNKIRRASTYVTTHLNVYYENILKDVLQEALHNTCDVSSFFVILRSMYEKTESGKERKVCINEAILDIMSFLSNRSSCIPHVIKYLYNNQLKISNDVCEALSLHLGNYSSSDILEQLANITEDSSVRNR